VSYWAANPMIAYASGNSRMKANRSPDKTYYAEADFSITLGS